jgi:hypothetical protein
VEGSLRLGASLDGEMVKRCSVGERDATESTSYVVMALWLRACLGRFGGGRVGGDMACWYECISRRCCILPGGEDGVGDDGSERRKLGHISSNSGRVGKAGASAVSTMKDRERAVHK